MTDPFSVLAASLTVADSSMKVIDVCTEYLSHAKNAPKEFQTIIEDIHDLTGTIKRLESFSGSREGRSELDQGFDQWQTPLKRLDGYAEGLVKIIERQDLKIGLFHELGFRARWPKTWREVDSLLIKIEREKNKLHLATAMDGIGLSRKVYMLVDERLPKNMHGQQVSQKEHSQVANENAIVWRSLWDMDPDELEATVSKEISKFTAWPDLSKELYNQGNKHGNYQRAFGERTCEEILTSNAYQEWKNRKIRGPSLLQVSGSAVIGKSILCSQVIQDLQDAYGPEVGVAYYYVDNHSSKATVPEAIVPTWIAQLALRCTCAPSESAPESFLQDKPPADASDVQLESWYRQRSEHHLRALFSILSSFRRTYIIVDGLDPCQSGNPLIREGDYSHVRAKEISAIVRSLLEQDFGNVSIAIFSRPEGYLDPVFDLADVSIRLLKAEPSTNTLSTYCQGRVEEKVKPELVTAGFRQPEIWLDDIVRAICIASDGLYLAVDMFINSTVDAIRDGTPIGNYLAYIRENSEIMMQRDPEIMKQKNFGPNEPNPVPSSGPVRKEA